MMCVRCHHPAPSRRPPVLRDMLGTAATFTGLWLTFYAWVIACDALFPR